MQFFMDTSGGIDIDEITSLLFFITTLLGVVSTVIVRVQKTLKDHAVRLIGDAEQKFSKDRQAGEKKRKYVVSALCCTIPHALRPFFTPERLEKMVQSTFATVSLFLKSKSALVQSNTSEEAPSPKGADEATDTTGAADECVRAGCSDKEKCDTQMPVQCAHHAYPPSKAAAPGQRDLDAMMQLLSVRGGAMIIRTECRIFPPQEQRVTRVVDKPSAAVSCSVKAVCKAAGSGGAVKKGGNRKWEKRHKWTTP